MINKKAYLNKDRLIRGVTEDGFFQIIVVKTTEVVQTAQQNHLLSPLASVILGRALTGVMLLSSSLKGEERIQLLMQGNGPLGIVTAEANSIGEIRGYAEHPDAMIDVKAGKRLEDGIGIGLLTFTKTLYNEARPITGTVELVSGNVSKDIAHYLLQSEQIPSAIVLDVQLDENAVVSAAGGILIKALPGAPSTHIEQLEQNLKNLPPVSTLFSQNLYIDDIMHQAMEPFVVHELSRTPVHFFCRCNKDRFKNAIKLLKMEELEEMSTSDQEMVCHYCNKKYLIEKEEILTMVRDKKIAMN